MYLLTVPNTEPLKKEVRFVFKNKMRDIGIVYEALKQTYLNLQEIRNPNYSDSISMMLQIYGQLAGQYSSLNELDSVLFYRHKSIPLSQIHPIELHQTGPYNNLGYFHLNHQNLDSAIYYFNLSDSILTRNQPLTPYWTSFQYSVHDNIATY